MTGKAGNRVQPPGKDAGKGPAWGSCLSGGAGWAMVGSQVGPCGEDTGDLGETDGTGIFQGQERGMRWCGGPAGASRTWWWQGDSETTGEGLKTSSVSPQAPVCQAIGSGVEQECRFHTTTMSLLEPGAISGRGSLTAAKTLTLFLIHV